MTLEGKRRLEQNEGEPRPKMTAEEHRAYHARLTGFTGGSGDSSQSQVDSSNEGHEVLPQALIDAHQRWLAAHPGDSSQSQVGSSSEGHEVVPQRPLDGIKLQTLLDLKPQSHRLDSRINQAIDVLIDYAESRDYNRQPRYENEMYTTALELVERGADKKPILAAVKSEIQAARLEALRGIEQASIARFNQRFTDQSLE